jgi:hypothetical protein
LSWDFRKPYTVGQAVTGKWGVEYVIGETEKRATIRSVESMWLKKRGGGKVFKVHVRRRRRTMIDAPACTSLIFPGELPKEILVCVWGDKQAQTPGMDSREIVKEARGPDERLLPNVGAR